MRRLRLQLILLLVAATVLPLGPAAWTARALLQRTLDPFEDPTIRSAAEAGLALGQEMLDRERERFLARIVEGERVDTLDDARIALLDPREQEAIRALAIGAAPDRITIDGRQMLAVLAMGPRGEPVRLVAALPGALVERASDLTAGLRLLEAVQRERPGIVRGLLLSFLMIYGAVLACILGVGLVLTSRLTRPLALLGDGIARVAGGDLASRVPVGDAGEMAALLRRFNEMVSRLGQQQADLVRLEKLAAWRKLARYLAHEVKNPLTPIQLAAQGLRDAYEGEDAGYRASLREGVGIIEEEVARLRELVREFSQFARLPEPQRIEARIDEILLELQELYGRDRLSIAVGAIPAEVSCDPGQVRRALMNLIDNALGAQEQTGSRAPIELQADLLDERRIVLRVLDRGPGVPTADRRRIFEPDFTTKPTGMGLGLAIVEETARAHGGSVTVEDRPGGGAIFALRIDIGPHAENEEGSRCLGS